MVFDDTPQPETFKSWIARRSRIEPEVAAKYAELRRMRRLAGGLLVGMTLAFVIATLGRPYSPAFDYLRAFAEASMVGACADWFAVVALFRRPFGLPIPHTGIVPRNKERIGAALGRFISSNFLSPAVLARRLDGIDSAGFCARWLSDPGNARRIAEQASRFLPEAFDALPKEGMADGFARLVLSALRALPAAPVASQLLALVWARGETQALLDHGVEYAQSLLARNKEVLRAKVTQKSSRFIPKWVDAMMAERAIDGVEKLLHEMRRPDHPWRQEVKATIEQFIDDLAENPEFRQRGESLKRDILDNPTFVRQIHDACQALRTHAETRLLASEAEMARAIEAALAALGRWLVEDQAFAEKLNRWSRRAVLRAVSPRRDEIGGYIASVVANWDASTLVNRLELQVGKDLQYIRINGAIVGGLVGEAIFVASKLLP